MREEVVEYLRICVYVGISVCVCVCACVRAFARAFLLKDRPGHAVTRSVGQPLVQSSGGKTHSLRGRVEEPFFRDLTPMAAHHEIPSIHCMPRKHRKSGAAVCNIKLALTTEFRTRKTICSPV